FVRVLSYFPTRRSSDLHAHIRPMPGGGAGGSAAGRACAGCRSGHWAAGGAARPVACRRGDRAGYRAEPGAHARDTAPAGALGRDCVTGGGGGAQTPRFCWAWSLLKNRATPATPMTNVKEPPRQISCPPSICPLPRISQGMTLILASRGTHLQCDCNPCPGERISWTCWPG